MTGVYGLSFEIALVNTVVTAAFLVPRRKRTLLLAVSRVSAIILLHAGKFYSPPALPDHARRDPGAVEHSHSRRCVESRLRTDALRELSALSVRPQAEPSGERRA